MPRRKEICMRRKYWRRKRTTDKAKTSTNLNTLHKDPNASQITPLKEVGKSETDEGTGIATVKADICSGSQSFTDIPILAVKTEFSETEAAGNSFIKEEYPQLVPPEISMDFDDNGPDNAGQDPDNTNEGMDVHQQSLFRSLSEGLACSTTVINGFHVNLSPENITCVSLYESDIPTVKCCVTIGFDCAVKIYVHRQCLSTAHSIWSTIPSVVTSVHDVTRILETLSSFSVCVGNPDDEFQNFDVGSVGVKEPDMGAKNGALSYQSTIRHKNCAYLVDGLRCAKCIIYRGGLRKTKSKKKKVPTATLR